jgi:hypothetical protein
VVEGEARGIAVAACPRCAAAVARSSEALGRLHFNHALELMTKGNTRSAEEQLCAACALLPTQVEPRRVLGKLRARLGNTEGAYLDLAWAKQLAPGDLKTAAAFEAVERTLVRRRRFASLALAAMFLFTAAAVVLSRFL